jgi:peptidoglycan/LPS O-acetylase OafA/YrhL
LVGSVGRVAEVKMTAMLTGVNKQLDDLVESTPADRDRFVDFLRAFAIAVVVVWHWVFSVLQRDNAELIMPNPLPLIPGSWLATWLLQIMPVFFFVGGFANLATWESVRRSGEGSVAFWRRRLRRLLVPTAVFVGVWAAVELALRVFVTGYLGVESYGAVVFLPLWFLAAYLWVIALVPLTARLHERVGWAATLGLGVVIAGMDSARFAAGVWPAGWVNTGLVWVLVHQLGYHYRDGTLEDLGRRGLSLLALAAAAALFLLTSLEVYPRSMVAFPGQEHSNIYPTNLTIAVTAVLQAAVALRLRPHLRGWLSRRRVWKPVVGANAVIMTIFLWHMTALLLALTVYEAAGWTLIEHPTAGWWLQRPLWLVFPLLFLVPLVALFHRVETGTASTE